MRFRIRTRFDVSLLLGWVAVALAVASFLVLSRNHPTGGGLDLSSHHATGWGLVLSRQYATGEIVWLSAGVAAAVTLCICPFLQPSGRGWKPAIWAFGVMLIPVVLIAFTFTDGGGGA